MPAEGGGGGGDVGGLALEWWRAFTIRLADGAVRLLGRQSVSHLTIGASGRLPAKAWIEEAAQKQKSFGSFLQKRTFFSALGELAIEIDSMALACKAAEQLQASMCSS